MVLTDWQTCDRDHIPVDKKFTASLTAWALPGGKVHCGVQSESSARQQDLVLCLTCLVALLIWLTWGFLDTTTILFASDTLDVLGRMSSKRSILRHTFRRVDFSN